jgi:hypothetical protein
MRRALAVGALMPLALVTVAGLVPACARTEDPPGVLMLAVETDMSAGHDKTVQAVGLYIRDLDRNRTLFELTEPVAPDGTVHFPATLAVIGRNNPGASIRIRVVGFSRGEAQVMRDAVTTIPTDRTALLRLPLRWVNYEKARGKMPQGGSTSPAVHTLAGESELDDPFGTLAYTTCTGETTTIDGACASWIIESAALPDFVEENVFGGGTAAGGGQCFDTEKCFATGVQTLPLDATCLIDKPPGTFTLAVKQPLSADRTCVGDGCFIPLEPDSPEGWTTDLGKIRLSPGTCKHVLDSNGKNTIVASSLCGSKAPNAPLCGEASAVGPGTDLPVDNPPPDGGLDATLDAPDALVDGGPSDVVELPVDIALGASPTQLLADNANLYYVTQGCVVKKAGKNQTPGAEMTFGFPLDAGTLTDVSCKIVMTPNADKIVLSKVGASDIEVFNVASGLPAQKPTPQEPVLSVSVSQTTLGWANVNGYLKTCGLASCTFGTQIGGYTSTAFITLDPLVASTYVVTNYIPPMVFSVPHVADGGAGGALAQTTSPVGPIVSDVNNVYWTVQAATGGIYSRNKTMYGSNTPFTVVAPENMTAPDTAVPHEFGIVPAGPNPTGFVFWTNGAHQVRGAPLVQNAVPITIASNQNEPRGIAVDATYVYWTSMGDGKVRRISRPATLK